METLKLEGGCWPNPNQELLLRAALWRGDEAVDAFNAWKNRVDINQVDIGSFRLLPLLYHNLSSQSIADPLMPKLKGIHRQTWYKNQLFFHNIAEILRAFHAAGIQTMLLKGPALALLYYKDYGLRPMDDFDVLVPVGDAPRAMKILAEAGWASKLKKLHSAEVLIPFRHCGEYQDRLGQQFDLHWHVLQECLQTGADDDFWADSIHVTLGEVSTRALNPTDQLLHVCLHGARWNPVPPLRWAADAVMILNSCPASAAQETEIDWERLVRQAQKRRLSLPLRAALTYLREKLNAPIPADVLTRLGNIPVTRREQIEYEARVRPQKVLGSIPSVWFDYSRSAEGLGYPQKLIRFARFLQYTWDVEYLWQVPFQAVSRSARRWSNGASSKGAA